MKSLYLVLLLGLSMPGCSMLTKSGRQERAYSKYTKYVRKMSASRDKQRSREIRQRAQMPTLRETPPVSEPQTTIETSASE